MAYINDDIFNGLAIKKKYKNLKLSIKENLVENIIINNICKIEKGMMFIDSQYRINGGSIDILAKDSDGKICIIELKNKSDAKDLIYQCVYYPTQFNQFTRMITLCPSYIYSIYICLSKLKYVEMKQYYIDKNLNIEIQDF
ncbi:DUF91 domain-containing protein [Clostridium botulinum]|nr:DUF91 domain-containing protein [Clostridium botulinum]EKS4395861.1 DUF91 domain-containing protein [Clostridium botulinum]